MPNYQDTELLSEDIDLITIIRKSKKIVNKWKKTIFYFSIIGIIGGGVYYIFMPPSYKSRMMVVSTLLKGPSFVVVIDDLQRHLKEDNHGEVARQLQLDSLTVSKLDEIRVYSVKNFVEMEFSSMISLEESPSEDEANTGEFIIEAYVKDGRILKSIEKGLVYYLNNNTYIKQKSVERRQNLRFVKEKVHNELIGLDSLKTSISKIYSGNNKMSANISINDPSSIYNNIILMYQTELNTLVEINSPDISVIQGFIPYRKPSFPKIGSSVISGFFMGLALSLIFIFYKESSERLNKI